MMSDMVEFDGVNRNHHKNAVDIQREPCQKFIGSERIMKSVVNLSKPREEEKSGKGQGENVMSKIGKCERDEKPRNS